MKIKQTMKPWALALFAIAATFTACRSPWEIRNPYEQVNWQKHKQYKANLHTHTTVSDGSLAPQYVTDMYHRQGYQILALTDHNAVSYPWTGFAALKPSLKSEERLKAGELQKENLIYENRDPAQLGMIAIQGNEVSSPHHINSLFNDYNRPTSQEDSAFSTIGAKNGLVIVNHPGRYEHSAQWYIDFYRKYDHLKGMEIYNNGDRYPGDRQLWDSVLVALLPARPVWAYSNDDMHKERSFGRNCNIFILPELNTEWARKGIEQGLSFYVYSPKGPATPSLPTIHSIRIRQRTGEIRLTVTGQDSVHWISGGKIIQKGDRIRLNDYPELSAYVRAEIFAADGVIMGTQPFSLKKVTRKSIKNNR